MNSKGVVQELVMTGSTMVYKNTLSKWQQVLKLLLSVVILSYSGLGLLSSSTKYQISHTAGKTHTWSNFFTCSQV